MNKRLSRALAAEAVKAVDECNGDTVAASNKLGVVYPTFRHRLRAAALYYNLKPRPKIRKPSTKLPPQPPATEAERREIVRLRAELARAREDLHRADSEALLASAIAGARGKIAAHAVPPPTWTAKPEKIGDSPGMPTLLLTDWHIGETVRAAEVLGMNRFDADTAEARVKALTQRTIALASSHVDKAKGGVVFLGGDFVSGWLHEELIRTDYCSPLEAAAWCVSRLVVVLRSLRDAWGRLYVCGVPGNHGRLTKRPPGKGHAAQSFDWFVYIVLAERLQENAEDRRTISLSVPDAGEQIVQVANTRYHVMHGHQLGVKGGDGIIGALGPITRGAVKVGTSNRSLGQDADVLVIGHFHTTLWLPRAIVGGTLRGFSEWDRVSRYSYEPASQLLWFTHPRWGANSPLRVFLQDPASAATRAAA